MATGVEQGTCPFPRTSVTFRQEDADTAVETDPTQRYLRVRAVEACTSICWHSSSTS
jgi:hypothetical protein